MYLKICNDSLTGKEQHGWGLWNNRPVVKIPPFLLYECYLEQNLPKVSPQFIILFINIFPWGYFMKIGSYWPFNPFVFLNTFSWVSEAETDLMKYYWIYFRKIFYVWGVCVCAEVSSSSFCDKLTSTGHATISDFIRCFLSVHAGAWSDQFKSIQNKCVVL